VYKWSVAYALLLVAIASEVCGTSLLKATEGFTRLWPTVGSVSGYAISILMLSLSIQRGMNVSIAYAIWSGIGTAAIVAIGFVFLRQPVTALQIGGIALVIAGVIVINLSGAR
jgi:small multidrug resistance pump